MNPNQISSELILATLPGYNSSRPFGPGLITFKVHVPEYVWKEILTHKRFARNSGSSRAQSTKRHIDVGHYKPDVFYTQGQGMTAGAPADDDTQSAAAAVWEKAWSSAAHYAETLAHLGIAKEQANRVLPSFKMVDGLLTATEGGWGAFLALRAHPTADIAIQILARQIKEQILNVQWVSSMEHIPFGERSQGPYRFMAAAGYIARISYTLRDDKDVREDLELAEQLMKNKHLSPFEHIATWEEFPDASAICSKPEDMGLVREYGWQSYRSELEKRRFV